MRRRRRPRRRAPSPFTSDCRPRTTSSSDAACADSPSDADAISSAFAAFSCVTLSIWPIALLTSSIPRDCSDDAAEISATSSVTFVTADATSPKSAFVFSTKLPSRP